MNFSDPTAVGADRVAEMVGAKSTYGAPALVIDLGTSTTFELLDETGAFRGGIIAPGMKLGAQALARGAAQLAAVELRAPKSLLGRTTVEAMQAGIVMGEVARIDGLIDMIWADCGYTTPSSSWAKTPRPSPRSWRTPSPSTRPSPSAAFWSSIPRTHDVN